MMALFCGLLWVALPFAAYIWLPEGREAAVVAHEIISVALMTALFARASRRSGSKERIRERRTLAYGFACITVGECLAGMQFWFPYGDDSWIQYVMQLSYVGFWLCLFSQLLSRLRDGTQPEHRRVMMPVGIAFWLFNLIVHHCHEVPHGFLTDNIIGVGIRWCGCGAVSGVATITLMISLITLSVGEFAFLQGIAVLIVAAFTLHGDPEYFTWREVRLGECQWAAALGAMAWVAVCRMAWQGKDILGRKPMSSLYSVRAVLGAVVFSVQLMLIGVMLWVRVFRSEDHSHVATTIYAVIGGWVAANTFAFFVVRNVGAALSHLAQLQLVATISTDKMAPLLVVPQAPSRRLLDEFHQLLHRNIELAEHINILSRALVLEQQDAARATLAADVAHDIRSPLAALAIVTKQVHSIPEEVRELTRAAIERIGDIANTLLSASNEASAANTEVLGAGITLVNSALDALVTEKRAQYRERPGLRIALCGSTAAYGAFVYGSPIELTRVVSNLINNAAEAIGKEGNIDVHLERCAGGLILSVEDNGVGVEPARLAALGARGTSFKAGGHGLGLASAKAYANRRGGNFVLNSEFGRGSTAVLRLPLAAPPAWFLTELVLTVDTRVVVVDEDASIHAVWKGRLSHLGLHQPLCHLSSAAAFNAIAQQLESARLMVLMDQRFADTTTEGLVLLQQHQMNHNAALVTSLFSDADLLRRCIESRVKVLPKLLVPWIPIRSEEAAPSDAALPHGLVVRHGPSEQH